MLVLTHTQHTPPGLYSKPLHFSVLLHALQFDVHQVVGLFLLFVHLMKKSSLSVLNIGGFGAQWFSSLVQVHPFSLLFLLTLYIWYCYCRWYCFFVCHFVDWLIYPNQVGVPCICQFIQVTLKVPSFIKVCDPWCIYISSTVGLIIYTSLLWRSVKLWIVPLMSNCVVDTGSRNPSISGNQFVF